MYKNKCLEYYLDSKIYSNEEVEQSINETKKEFSDKNIKVNVTLNNFGVYVITYTFENKSTFFNRIKIKFKRKFKKQLLLESGKNDRMEKYSGEPYRYGQYKSTGTYKPY